MPRGVINKFNRGEIDSSAMLREDVKRVTNSAQSMVNFIPLRTGPMMYRPGTEYLHTLDSGTHKNLPFIAAINDTAIINLNDSNVGFIINDAHVTTTAVTSTIGNDDFSDATIAPWIYSTGTVTASPGSSISDTYAWYGAADGEVRLKGDGVISGSIYQTITDTQVDTQHSLRVIIVNAPVRVSIGTSGNGSYEIYDGLLTPGVHVLTFTPASNFTITLSNSLKYNAKVMLAQLEGTADLILPTPLTSASLASVRDTQSGDIIYNSNSGGEVFAIEHRGDKSWSSVSFEPDDGPFEVINNSEITLQPNALNGNAAVASSIDFFETAHVGALFKIVSNGQNVTANVSVDTGAGTNSIQVFGTGTGRSFFVSAAGMATSTVTLQRSADAVTWEDVEQYTVATGKSFNDGLDGSNLHYRLYVKAGDNTGLDAIVLDLVYASGSITGICRMIAYDTATNAFVEILQDFGSLDATLDWYEGSWSNVKQHPSAIELSEGRLWLGGKNETWGSVSDAYSSFDRSILGDSASIHRTIGFGPTDPVKWMMETSKLVMATVTSEMSIRSNSFGDIMTPTNANIKGGSTLGADDVSPVKIDGTIYFVQRSGRRLYSLISSIDRDTFEVTDINVLNSDICSSGITTMAVARQPETRIFAVLADGNMAILTVDPSEEVAAWSRFEVDGTIDDVVVLPDADEDRVYLVITRTISGSPVIHLEKMAKFSEAEGGVTSKTFDSFLSFTSPGTTISGLGHLEGKTVGVWADSQDRGTFTVSGGSITVPAAYTSVIVGLRYVADYISSKVSGYQPSSVLMKKKRIVDTGIALENYWPGSLKIGPTASTLKDLPGVENGTAVDQTTTISEYNEVPFEFDSDTEVDPRIYMRATGPCKILALTYQIDAESDDPNS